MQFRMRAAKPSSPDTNDHSHDDKPPSLHEVHGPLAPFKDHFISAATRSTTCALPSDQHEKQGSLHDSVSSCTSHHAVATPTSPGVIGGPPFFPDDRNPPPPPLGAALPSEARATLHARQVSASPPWASAAVARAWHPADQGEWWWQRGCALVTTVAAEVAAAGGGERAQAILAATLGPDGRLLVPPAPAFPPSCRLLPM